MKKNMLNEEVNKMRSMMGLPAKKLNESYLYDREDFELNGRPLDMTVAHFRSDGNHNITLSDVYYADVDGVDNFEELTPEECAQVVAKYKEQIMDALGQEADDQMARRIEEESNDH
jgi:hypothetical protein